MDRFFKPFNILAIRVSSDIIRSAAPRVLYLITHFCSYIKYYIKITTFQLIPGHLEYQLVLVIQVHLSGPKIKAFLKT